MKTHNKPSFSAWLALAAIICEITAQAVILPVAEDISSTAAGTLTTTAGSTTTLAVAPTRQAFVRFDLSDVPASITSSNIIRARLTLYVIKATVPADLNVQIVTSDWHEKTPTVPTPGFAGTVAIVPAAKVAARRFIVADVTEGVIGWLNGSADFGFAITTATGNLTLGSKEGPAAGYPAMLEIEGGSGLPGPQGPTGTTGPQGPQGPAGTITDGSVTAAKLASDIGVWSASGGNVFRTNGNVGIGTNNPTTRLEVAGTVKAAAFSGDGSGLNSLNATNLVGSVPFAALTTVPAENLTGTLADARLSANVALRVGGNTFNGTQIITNGSVGIGTNNPAAQLEVGGDINSNAKSVPVGEEKLRIIRGTVAADGSVLDGKGFTVNFTHGGLYNIIYDNGFSGKGTLVATPTNYTANVTFGIQPSSQNCLVHVYQNGSDSDVGFSFIVVGPR